MIVLALTVTLIACLIVLMLSYSRKFGELAGSIANPLAVAGLLLLVYWFDFFLALLDLQSGDLRPIRAMNVSSVDHLLRGLEIYMAGVIALCIGVGTALVLPSDKRKRRRLRFGRYFNKTAYIGSWITLLVSVGVILSALVAQGVNIHSVLANRQLFYSENALLQVVIAMNRPAVIFLIAALKRLTVPSVLLILGHMCALLLLGGRSFILYIGLAIILRLGAQKLITRLPAALVLVPASFYLFGVLRYFLRDRNTGIGLSDFLSRGGGIIAESFRGIEISISHVLATIAARQEELSRIPFESFLALVVYPIPREIFPMKPLGASTEFSQLVHPDHWALHRSETVISGFGDLHLMFGYFSIIPVYLLGLWLTRVIIRAEGARTQVRVIVITFAGAVTFAFLRGDLYNLSPLVWGLVIYWGLFTALRMVFSSVEGEHGLKNRGVPLQASSMEDRII